MEKARRRDLASRLPYYPGPHHHDLPLRDLVAVILEARPAGLSVEAANPRHAHEWRVWEEVPLPDDKVLIPGVIDTTTNFIEHPDLVAERIVRYRPRRRARARRRRHRLRLRHRRRHRPRRSRHRLGQVGGARRRGAPGLGGTLAGRLLTPPVQRKVLAYITHAGRLLVFRQPESPEAGIQVPGGTVEADEDPAIAVLREAREETGVEDLTVAAFLGKTIRAFPNTTPGYPSGVVFHRFIYHLRCLGTPPATWRHFECLPSEGDPRQIPFDFFWVAIPDGVPELTAHQGELLPALVRALNEDKAH